MPGPANRPRQHLRDAATICPDISGWGRLAIRCERDAGHDGKHKNGCAHWGQPALALPADDTPRRTVCRHCGGPAEWIDCPTGGWWAHDVHPTDGHDAEPTP